jgi:DNA-directed RNA polymerase specialized sigma24 family protein
LRPEAAAEQHAEPWADAEDSRPIAAGEDAVSSRLDQMLSSLPMPLRTAVVLRYGEGMKPSEIAAMLGQPLATTKCNLQRALMLLRRKADTVLKEYVRA